MPNLNPRRGFEEHRLSRGQGGNKPSEAPSLSKSSSVVGSGSWDLTQGFSPEDSVVFEGKCRTRYPDDFRDISAKVAPNLANWDDASSRNTSKVTDGVPHQTHVSNDRSQQNYAEILSSTFFKSASPAGQTLVDFETDFPQEVGPPDMPRLSCETVLPTRVGFPSTNDYSFDKERYKLLDGAQIHQVGQSVASTEPFSDEQYQANRNHLIQSFQKLEHKNVILESPGSDLAKPIKRSTSTTDHQCGLSGCLYRCSSLKDLKKHRYFEHADAYCNQCDLGFDNFDKLLSHKVSSHPQTSCPICAEDFKSTYSRDVHISTAHPESTAVDCPGCLKAFSSCGAMVAHIENDHCNHVSAQQLIKLRVITTLIATKPDNKQNASADKRAEAVVRSFGSVKTFIGLGRSPEQSQSSRLVVELGRSDEMTFEGLTNSQNLQYLGAAQVEETRRLVRVIWGGSPLLSAPDRYDTGCNGIASKNPFLPDFNPNHFRLSSGAFKCPARNCISQFRSGEELQEHMRSKVHTLWTQRCPECMKEFGEVSRLITHWEGHGNRCQIRKRHWFPRMMEIASSGLLIYNGKNREGPVFKGTKPKLLE